MNTSQIDKESDTWKVIEKFLIAQVAHAQTNCMEQISYEETTYWRGYYKAAKEVQALATPKIKVEITLPDNT
mgnify:CR=1 FL=1